jgi:hypothetical protein
MANPGTDRKFDEAYAALETALDEYYKLVDRWDLNLYSGDDEAVAERVISRLLRIFTNAGEGMFPGTGMSISTLTEEDFLQWAHYVESMTPGDITGETGNKGWFRIIMTGLGTTHMSGLNNTDAKAAWRRFTSKLADLSGSTEFGWRRITL